MRSGCLWALVDGFLGGFDICVVESPLTGYLFLFEVAPLLLLAWLDVVTASDGCLGKTKAFVCFRR